MPTRASRALLAAALLLAASLLAASRPLAAAGRWTEIGPSGGVVLSLAVQPDDPDVLYAGTRFGVFKSVDRGAHWAPAGEPFGRVADLAVDPSRPATVYAAAGEALRRSADSGQTWVRVGADVAEPTALAVTSGGTVHAGTGSGLFSSLDGGESWLARRDGLPAAPVAAIAIDPDHQETLYAGMQFGGLYKSEDGGAQWRKLGGAPLERESILSLAIAPADGRILYASTTIGLYRSQDGGDTWTLLRKPFMAWSLAVHRSLPDVVWAGTPEGVLLSRDGGATWLAVAGPSERVAELVADPGDPATVWAGATDTFGRGGVYRSVDAGERWSFQGAGLTAADVSALAVDPRTTATLYASTGHAVLRSRDRGRNWELLPLQVGSIRDVEVDPTFPSTIYALGDEGLFRSSDRGDTWTSLWRFHLHGSHSLRVDPQRPATLYASVQGLYKSTNRGRKWTRLELPVPSLSVGPIEIAPSEPWTLYVLARTQPSSPGGLRSHLLRSRDRGRSWTIVDPSSQVRAFAVDPQDARTVYAATRAGIFRTADGGDRWTLVNVDFRNPDHTPELSLAVGRGTPPVLYLAHSRSVFRSFDRGVTWTPMDEGLTGFYETGLLTPDPREPGRLYLGLRDHGLAAFEP